MSGKLQGMGMRRRARERALQFLYQNDLNPALNLEEALGHFFESQRRAVTRDENSSDAAPVVAAAAASGTAATTAIADAPAPLPPLSAEAQADLAAAALSEEITAQRFADPLIRGVIRHLESLDAEIQKYAHNWDVRRMAAVD
ncbi:MAG: hypothetical protein HYR88_12175, partial [Verrucomicrobia bacterium]|nr:hypothetical protein [Verrucomicrobiota bacterium]